MLVYYVIRNTRTGKYYNQNGRFTKLDAVRTWVFHSTKQANEIAFDAPLKRVAKHLEVVPVQLLRV